MQRQSWFLAIVIAATPASAQQAIRIALPEAIPSQASSLAAGSVLNLSGPQPIFTGLTVPNLVGGVPSGVTALSFPAAVIAPRAESTALAPAAASPVERNLEAARTRRDRASVVEQLRAIGSVLRKPAPEQEGASGQAFDGSGESSGRSFFEPQAADLSPEQLVALPGIAGFSYDSEVYLKKGLAAPTDRRRTGAARYLAEVKLRSDRLYRRFFPEFYREFPLALAFEPSARVNATHQAARDGTHQISFLRDGGFSHDLDFSEVQPVIGGSGSAKIQARVDLLVTFVHEYAHGIFDDVVFGREGHPLHYHSGDTPSYSAMTEGFAVMMELLMADKMIAAREELGLTDRDVADLKLWKTTRLHSLQRKDNHYTFGAFRFWHALSKKEGEAGMLRFLESLDGPRLFAVPLPDLGLRLSARNPALFKAYLAKDGDAATRQALLDLADYGEGRPIKSGALKRARAVLERTDGPALRTVLRKSLNVQNGSGSGLETVLRLAQLSPRAATELAQVLSAKSFSADAMERLFRGRSPAKVSLLLDGAGRLPMPEAQREEWLQGLERWVRGQKVVPATPEEIALDRMGVLVKDDPWAVKAVIDHIARAEGTQPEKIARRLGIAYPRL